MQGFKVQLKVYSKEKEIGDREMGKIWGSEDTGVRNGSGEAWRSGEIGGTRGSGET